MTSPIDLDEPVTMSRDLIFRKETDDKGKMTVLVFCLRELRFGLDSGPVRNRVAPATVAPVMQN